MATDRLASAARRGSPPRGAAENEPNELRLVGGRHSAADSAYREFTRRIDIGGGRHLYLECKGRGSPAVILESGIHDSSDPWSITDTEPPVPSAPAVFAAVARFTRVCKYDRPGTIRYTKPIALITRSSPVYE